MVSDRLVVLVCTAVVQHVAGCGVQHSSVNVCVSKTKKMLRTHTKKNMPTPLPLFSNLVPRKIEPVSAAFRGHSSRHGRPMSPAYG